MAGTQVAYRVKTPGFMRHLLLFIPIGFIFLFAGLVLLIAHLIRIILFIAVGLSVVFIGSAIEQPSRHSVRRKI